METIYILIGYALIINVVAFFTMGIDKKRSKAGAWRISEKTIWSLAFIGGAIGSSFGMRLFSHKTKHRSFQYGLPILGILEAFIFFYLIYRISN
ncbi:DUF1294 domain-containing protein [Aquibacillus halophilus]|uniref:DUF1294 domain-containing protein n=1 Tax=Aquibacillus halophilus TaxID=930132 RepID=A0A6A8DB07_9BACI|nr:DUF1294 domain-containing protein [Aquibacillus halophilus]MRH42905.1 DUF1294 domain-containing protein [Aquibacillus halophilus]